MLSWLILIYLVVAGVVAYRSYQNRTNNGWPTVMAALVTGASWPITVWKVFSAK